MGDKLRNAVVQLLFPNEVLGVKKNPVTTRD